MGEFYSELVNLMSLFQVSFCHHVVRARAGI